MSDPTQPYYTNTPRNPSYDEHAFSPQEYGNQATYYHDHMRMRGSHSYESPHRGSILEAPLFFGSNPSPQGPQGPHHPVEPRRISPTGLQGIVTSQDPLPPTFIHQSVVNENFSQSHSHGLPGHAEQYVNHPNPYDARRKVSLDCSLERGFSIDGIGYTNPPQGVPVAMQTTSAYNSLLPAAPFSQNSTEAVPAGMGAGGHSRFPSFGNDDFFALQHFDNTAGVFDAPAPPKAVAPRSAQFYRVGPPFYPTKTRQLLFAHNKDELIKPMIFSRIDRGFEQGEAGSWIGYKRNYLTLVASFQFSNWTRERVLNNTFYIFDANEPERKLSVKYFALTISVKCNDSNIDVGLVQHTPKRDKGPKEEIPIYPAVPDGALPDHSVVSSASNKKNEGRVANRKKVFGFDRQAFYEEKRRDPQADGSLLKNYPADQITQVALFERIQFTKSLRVETSRAAARYFTLSVDLLGVLDLGEGREASVILASSDTVPLFVRGRSPSSYPSEKTSGYRGAGYSH